MKKSEPAGSKTIQMLFDLQKFRPNKRLQALTEAVAEKYLGNQGCRELSDDEIEVWAAGSPAAGQPKKKPSGEVNGHE